MIYQDVKRFLKRHLQKPSKEYEWGGHDNFLLLNFIQSRYSDAYIKSNMSEIRQAFRDFFEPIGNVVVRFKVDTGVAYKILPYHIKPNNSKHLKEIVALIRKNRRWIEYPYKGRVDQIALLGKIRRHINALIIETDEAVNKKELVRYAIKEALELDKRDVVVHLKRKFIVKLFKKNDYLNATTEKPTQRDESERRFGGYSADDLSQHYKELISDIDLLSFLDDVMAGLFVGSLNFDEITNSYYEKNVLRIVRNAIAQELQNYVSENEEYLIGFAGYIFRHNFMQIHERIAIEILEKISVKSKAAAKFIEYYSGTIIVEEGKKYIIPEITTPDGQRWNVQSVTAITNMWLRAKGQQGKLEVQLKNLVQKFNMVETNYKQIDEQNSGYEQKLESLEKEALSIQNSNAEIKRQYMVDGFKDKEQNSLSDLFEKNKNQLASIELKIKNLKQSKYAIRDELKSTRTEYMEMKKHKQNIESEINNLKNNLNINSDSFHSILASLVKALTQRKKLTETL